MTSDFIQRIASAAYSPDILPSVTIAQVPEIKREEVKHLLIEMGYPELADAKQQVQEE